MYCYFPTQTVVIDDDVDFLTTVTQHSGIADCIPYSQPDKAIAALRQHNAFQRIRSRILKTTDATEYTTPEDYAVVVNMKGLHEEIYSPDRFQDVSVIVVDYYMDDLCGLDVCEALANHPAKKILLTGGADKEKLAIEAFNRGIIHRFISKSDPNFPNQLSQAITILKEAYFRDLTSSLIPYTTASTHANILQNPAYINFIRNIQTQFNAVEYYLLDTAGSCVFLDMKGMPIWLVVKHESELKDFEDIAKDQEASVALIEKLANREVIPFFFTENDYQSSVKEWGACAYPANALPGVNGYHYTIIEGHVRNNLNFDKIASYRCSTA